MRILAIDIGMGTQDILLFDSSSILENCVQMIMPSPTSIIAGRISRATAQRHPVLLNGVTMGGGSNSLALARHIKEGLPVYATAEAALTFNDDLETVKEIGVTILSPDEVPGETDLEIIELKDLDLPAIRKSLEAFGVDTAFDALAVSVLDHGFAPDMSNRIFRFDHLRKLVAKRGTLSDFCYLADEIPGYLNRARAVVSSAGDDIPLLFTDTGVAAVLGSLQDREVTHHNNLIIINTGNSHTIAFHLVDNLIKGLFEHHTGMLNTNSLDSLITRLAQGVLTNEEVFEGGGHGALIIKADNNEPFISITGPRQDIVTGSSLELHKAVPYGDVMLTGCYGLIKAWAMRMDNWRDEIEQALLSG
ncbi:DUF1786 domain-containing protein [Chloroflexota bacterium]